jgi:hypothetical protein
MPNRRQYLRLVAAVLFASIFIVSTSYSRYYIKQSVPLPRRTHTGTLGPEADLVYRNTRVSRRVYQAGLESFVANTMDPVDALRTIQRMDQFFGQQHDARDSEGWWDRAGDLKQALLGRLWKAGEERNGDVGGIIGDIAPTIPEAIHQTWRDSEPYGNFYDSWKGHHPDWQYTLSNDEAVEKVLQKVHVDWDALMNATEQQIGAMKADIWRYLVLSLEG